MQEFSRTQARTPLPSWIWVLSAAAALLVAVFVGHEAGKRTREAVPAAIRSRGVQSHTVQTAQPVLYEASYDASALSNDDFVAVPYSPPLAPGEMVRMVRTEMYPEALASMGVEVDPAWTGNLSVELVVGEDGIPRAVRIAEDGQY
jgi:hypothetical protein